MDEDTKFLFFFFKSLNLGIRQERLLRICDHSELFSPIDPQEKKFSSQRREGRKMGKGRNEMQMSPCLAVWDLWVQGRYLIPSAALGKASKPCRGAQQLGCYKAIGIVMAASSPGSNEKAEAVQGSLLQPQKRMKEHLKLWVPFTSPRGRCENQLSKLAGLWVLVHPEGGKQQKRKQLGPTSWR